MGASLIAHYVPLEKVIKAVVGESPVREQTFQRYDLDKDGVISKSEFERYAREILFQRYDVNGDSTLSREKFPF